MTAYAKRVSIRTHVVHAKQNVTRTIAHFSVANVSVHTAAPVISGSVFTKAADFAAVVRVTIALIDI